MNLRRNSDSDVCFQECIMCISCAFMGSLYD